MEREGPRNGRELNAREGEGSGKKERERGRKFQPVKPPLCEILCTLLEVATLVALLIKYFVMYVHRPYRYFAPGHYNDCWWL